MVKFNISDVSRCRKTSYFFEFPLDRDNDGTPDDDDDDEIVQRSMLK